MSKKGEDSVVIDVGDLDEGFRGKESEDMINIKLAAVEAHKRSRIARDVGFMGVAGVLITAIFSSFGPMIGSVAGMVFCVVLAFVLFRVMKDLNYLRDKYGLK